MNRNSQILIHLLSKAIRNQNPDMIFNEPIDWNAVYEEAVAHQVHTLIFPVLSQLPPEYKPARELMGVWQKAIKITALFQLQHIHQISIVLNDFNREDIPVVVLKGLVLRNYYPQPELRTMGDADLLVHKEDMIRAEKLLKAIGYKAGKISNKHISFYYMNYPAIELHWALTDKESREDSLQFSSMIWDNTIDTKINGVPALILSAEDQIMHLLFHTVHHLLSTGFGLRQLCDFVLFLEAKDHTINLEDILIKADFYHIHKYTIALLLVCNKLLDYKIPDILYATSNDSYIDLLINDILKAGVYGRKSQDRDAGTRLLKYIDINESAHKFNSLHNVILFLFPSVHKLSQRYDYAKKLPLLLPFAWIHRFANNLKRLNTLQLSKDIETSGKDRAKLLQWLQLR
ncbi:MAG: nucleotidyltransferase family protein [Anaerocolumna sp.]